MRASSIASHSGKLAAIVLIAVGVTATPAFAWHGHYGARPPVAGIYYPAAPPSACYPYMFDGYDCTAYPQFYGYGPTYYGDPGYFYAPGIASLGNGVGGPRYGWRGDSHRTWAGLGGGGRSRAHAGGGFSHR